MKDKLLLLAAAALLAGLPLQAREGSCDTLQPAAQSDILRIVCVGDIVLGLNYPDESPLLPEQDGARLFDGVRDLLTGADLTLGNLEGVLLDRGGEPKKVRNAQYRYHFRMPERYAGLLVGAGFDALSIANNHARDFGTEGLESTRRVLREAGIAHAGVEGVCEKTVIVRDSVRYGFCAFAPNAAMCNIHDYALAERLVRSLREEDSCRIVIVSFHGGAEGSTQYRVPRTTEQYAGESRGNVYEFAHRCIDAGADLVFGHGPHVVRGMELYRGKPIAYSLGNFCTPFGVNKLGRNGYAPVLCVEFSADGEFLGGELISAVQTDRSGPRPDAARIVVREIRNLSLTDFPESPLTISEEGKLSVR